MALEDNVIKVGVVHTGIEQALNLVEGLSKIEAIISNDLKSVSLVSLPDIMNWTKEDDSTFGTEEMNLMKELAQRFQIHIIFSINESNTSSLCQFIVDRRGFVQLSRKNPLSQEYDANLSGSVVNNVLELEYNSKIYETGVLTIKEHYDPLMVFNSTRQYEKIHTMFIEEEEGLLNEDIRDQFFSLCSSYSMQTQSFSLLSSIDSDKCIMFCPDGSKQEKEVESDRNISVFTLNMRDVTIQKTFFDPNGHTSLLISGPIKKFIEIENHDFTIL